jgi:hypothetical protein
MFSITSPIHRAHCLQETLGSEICREALFSAAKWKLAVSKAVMFCAHQSRSLFYFCLHFWVLSVSQSTLGLILPARTTTSLNIYNSSHARSYHMYDPYVMATSSMCYPLSSPPLCHAVQPFLPHFQKRACCSQLRSSSIGIA